MRNILPLIAMLIIVVFEANTEAATMKYTYDAQHRLVQASFGAAAKVFINYDAAGNMDQQVVITDAKYLQSWLWYFSMLGYPGYPLSPAMGLFAKNI